MSVPSTAHAIDATPDGRRKRGETMVAVAVSLLFHTLILAILAAVTWVVIREAEPEVVLELGGGGGGGGGNPGAASSGDPSSSPGDATGVAQSDPSRGALEMAAAAPAPAPTDFSDLGALAQLTPAPPEPTQSAPALDLALSAFNGLGAGAGGGGSGTGKGAGSGSGTGPGSGSGSGGGSGAGIGPGVGAGMGPGLDGLLGDMRRRGLDVVFVLDATASMTPSIEQGKERLRDIVAVVTTLVGGPAAEGAQGGRKDAVRFGLVAFKDYGDEYGIEATRVTPLTSDVEKLQNAINAVSAHGGADEPEPLHDALRAATSRSMDWNRQRKSVIVLVTDAPCHSLGRPMMIEQARNFSRTLGGQINVLDVGNIGKGDADTVKAQPPREGVLADLQTIAREGKGSSFMLEDEASFWRHTVVSIFGQRYEQDVQQIIDRYVKTQRPSK